MKILGFAASNSKNSINNKLVKFVLSNISDEAELINITDYEMPIYSIDYETEVGIPAQAQKFLDKIAEFDLIVISHAEHNGNYNVFYKNLLDWCSRVSTNIFQGKKLVLLATSPGEMGGKNVLEIAKKSAPIFNGELCFSMSIPSFYDNFKDDKLTNNDLKQQLFNNLKAMGVNLLGL
ncbi:NAD(P)H-dependent oxidoreductase [Francisella sp. LA112445]|uniref:NADPH-dependent FMN reductase n=1 Tax=Francisella sp. LA112445 TaxID=1395624 RepID=UPI001788DBD2|nr:NAD(P)H-dependent oxidoreductase [Francisella sp. LA112445]QIW09988.1 NAD(P)H-dependent oxidoreductase [Francisella sp. LA112445]